MCVLARGIVTSKAMMLLSNVLLKQLPAEKPLEVITDRVRIVGNRITFEYRSRKCDASKGIFYRFDFHLGHTSWKAFPECDGISPREREW